MRCLRRSHALTIGLMASVPLLFPSLAAAADVRCDCLAPEETDTTCVSIDATKLENPNDCGSLPENAKLESGWACERDPLSASQFRSVSKGGVCVNGPVSALSLVGEPVQANNAPEPDTTPILQQLNVSIPGFVIPAKGSDLFGAYVLALYRYGISIAAIAATVMFIYGAFLYLLGGAMSSIRTGKRVMTDAVIGMILVFSAAVIARTLNPELLELNRIDVTTIQSRSYEFIRDNDYRKLTGTDKISTSEMKRIAMEKAAETDIEELPCMVEAVLAHESGGAIDAVGHDENSQTTNYAVNARQNFLQSGLFYSGLPFEAVSCSDASCQNEGPTNDDHFNVKDPPNYGLDWRYSHGFGPGQLTIFPHETRNRPCEGREDQGYGYRINGACYTIPELLTPEVAAIAMVNTLRSALAQAGNDVPRAFVNYAGTVTDDADNPAIQSRVRAYEACRAKAN
jgi:hypothetical protein